MKSLERIGNQPRGIPLVADEVTEFHAARILLLLKLCGIAGRIEGLTKLAKLDFFVRYPEFFERLANHMNQRMEAATSEVDSAMVRHHYGPWDKRYYQILPYLESRRLIAVTKDGNKYVFKLTPEGERVASQLTKRSEYRHQVEQMKQVKKLVGGRSGTVIKNLIYKVFDEEVGQKALGKIIQ